MTTDDSIDMKQLQAAADRAQSLLKVLANRDRLMLLCQLAEGERNVGELEERLGILQPTLSQQLGVLRAREWSRRAVRASRSTIGSPVPKRWR